MARQLTAEGRYALVLLREAADAVTEADAAPAWAAISDEMALVPAGLVPVVHSNGGVGTVDIAGYYLDRFAVSNRQFQKFVDAGGYDNLEIWPREVWPSLMKFVDRTHRPGPRDWAEGRHPPGKADHPVVGVCWYEAAAYASWVGKRLPTAAEWQKAGGWPEQLSGGTCRRYPWGDVFEPARANLGRPELGRTVPVREFAIGATPNGIYQMTGNVWEWLADPLEAIPCRADEAFEPERPMRRIGGGAFDTYFPAEATCQFVTGQPELDRRENIGFRCAVGAGRLRPRP
jgi:iron(II)-dependent oxidoreductase